MKFRLEDEDREKLHEMQILLEMFEVANNDLQSNQVSVSRVWPTVRLLQVTHLENLFEFSHTGQLRKSLHKSLSTRFNKILEDEVFAISTFLDPTLGELSLVAIERVDKLVVVIIPYYYSNRYRNVRAE